MKTVELITLVNQQMDDSFLATNIIPLFNLCLMELSAARTAYGNEPFKMLVDQNSETELEEMFHDLLVEYAIGKLQFQEEDYDERPDRMNQFYQRKQEYIRYLARQTIPHDIDDIYGGETDG